MTRRRFTARDRLDAIELQKKRWPHFTLAEELEDKRVKPTHLHRRKFWRLSELRFIGVDGSFMKSVPK